MLLSSSGIVELGKVIEELGIPGSSITARLRIADVATAFFIPTKDSLLPLICFGLINDRFNRL